MHEQKRVLVGRRATLGQAVAAVKSHSSVEILGPRGSGKSAFLSEISVALSAEGWTVVFIRGVAYLKQFPLAALQLPGVIQSDPQLRGQTALPLVAASLRSLVSGDKSVILLDDWSDLDPSSWGVVEHVHRSSGVPIVLVRRQGNLAPRARADLSTASIQPSLTIDMMPLRMDEIAAALRTRLDALIEPKTLGLIYAKSGGNIGLSLALAETGIREHRLVRGADGVWTGAADLWSPSLRAVLETHLEDLPKLARDALETIAMVGAVEIETVRDLVPWDVIELLEQRALLAFFPTAQSSLVSVAPPLLVDYFRHQPFSARRIRLGDEAAERIGKAESTPVQAGHLTPEAAETDNEALFAGLVRERARARQLTAAAEWRAHPTPVNATRYVSALMQEHSPAMEEAIDRVFQETDRSREDPENRAEFVALYAAWLAYTGEHIDGALELLRRERVFLGPHARIVDAAEVTILTNLSGVPDDFPSRLEADGGLPPKVRLALLEAQMLVLVSRCRFAEAIRVFERIRVLDAPGESLQPRVLLGLALLGQGDQPGAAQVLRNGFEEARATLDVEAFRAFGSALALAQGHLGDYTSVDALLDSMFVVGESKSFPPAAQLPLFSLASHIAFRRGQASLTERYAADARRQTASEGPLPAQSAAWAVSHDLLLRGKLAEAADELWTSGVRLWQRGALFPGIHSMLTAVEIDPRRGWVVEALRRLEEIPEARAMQAQGAYVAALCAEDAEAMLLSAVQLMESGRRGVAITACQYASQWFAMAGRGDRVEAAQTLERSIRSSGDARLEVLRYSTPQSVLTHREREVAVLASDGLTNKEIASRLTLSVRTVDSHMRRIMRKLAVSSRQELAALFHRT